MAAANSAMDAYRAGQAVGQAGKAMQEAMEMEIWIPWWEHKLTYGSTKERITYAYRRQNRGKSQVNAGGKVNIVATGAGKASNITIHGSDVSGKQGTFLEADNDIKHHGSRNKTHKRAQHQ